MSITESSPQELTVPGQDKSVTVETLPSATGELEVHQVVAGLLGSQLPVEMVLVTGPPLSPHQLLRPLQAEVHLLFSLGPAGTIRASSVVGRWRLATDHRKEHQPYFILIWTTVTTPPLSLYRAIQLKNIFKLNVSSETTRCESSLCPIMCCFLMTK